MMHRNPVMFRNYGWFPGLIIGLLLIGLIIYGIYRILDNRKINSNEVTWSKQALAILDERYARGELEEDEYKKMKNNLTQK